MELSDDGTIDVTGDSTIADLIECLPVIEYLSIWFFIYSCFLPLPKELPTTLVHLKYLCMECVCFIHEDSLPFLVLLIRSSPNLEKLKLEILDEELRGDNEACSYTLEDYSDIMLEQRERMSWLL
ncbi:hypothetical protein L1987_10571 [Smallanthus sonchifolius]|uniref:Uncharacterized protein n=1 Tax=Smallanthus sonchifolius TaxID=185202 RepID=A0ACB9JSK2_9ASTR|nr:hypothetical protein L1987_10571 [Smallanthus sonchifolius]